MPDTFITDMRDYADASGIQPSPPVERMRRFLTHIVRAATATGRSEFVSAVACRRRPRHRPCAGSIAVLRADDREPYIYWACTACGDSGRVAGFQGDPDDLSVAARADLTDATTARAVTLSSDEYQSWIAGDLVAYDLRLVRIIYSATRETRGVTLSIPASELDDLLDALSADANHETSKRRRIDLASIDDKLSRRNTARAKRSVAKSVAKKAGSSRRSRNLPIDPNSAYAHGFFAATIAGPMTMPTQWLMRFIPAETTSLDALNACAQRVMTAYNHVVGQLLEHRARFGDVMLDIARSDATGAALIDWQRGFREAVDLNADEWSRFLDRIASTKLLAPLAMIAQVSSDPQRVGWLTDAELRDNLGRSLAVMTARLWEAYRGEASTHVEVGGDPPFRRGPKVARDAPCPCGSGKKHKHCCGSPLRAV